MDLTRKWSDRGHTQQSTRKPKKFSPANYINATCTSVRYFTTLLSYVILIYTQIL